MKSLPDYSKIASCDKRSDRKWKPNEIFLTALLISAAMIKIQVYYQELLNSCPAIVMLQKNQQTNMTIDSCKMSVR